MPDASDKRGAALTFRPIDRFSLRFEGADHVIRMVFYDIIVDTAPLRCQTISGASKQARCSAFAAANLFTTVSITHRQGCSVVTLQPALLDKSATDGLNLRLALR
jgi:hypothetical protein